MDLEKLAQAAVAARKATQSAREALIAAEEKGEGVKEAKRSLRKSIIARDKANEALKEAEHVAGKPAVIGAESDAMDAGIVAPEPGPDNEWEERMSKQRSDWRAQDDAKFINPSYDPELDVTWHIYMWRGGKKGWEKVGETRKKTGRRKHMTTNRLFANIRQKFEIAATVPVKLISKQDDVERLKKGQLLAPPEHKKGLRPDEPRPESLATPGKRAVTPPVRVIKGKPAPKQKVKPAAAPPKPKPAAGDKIRFASWGAMHGRTYFLGASKAVRAVDAKHEAQAAFAGHVGIKTVAIANMPYAVRNQIADGELVAGVTEMEAP